MYLKHLEIIRIRNLHQQQLELDAKHNFFFGDNAQGKTNLLEAVYILCLAKSFRVREDVEMIPFGEEAFAVDGRFLGEFGIERQVGVSYSVEEGKRIHLDGKKVNQISRLVGQFPVVVLSSDDYSITTGPPSQRRRFFNLLFSQSSLRYLEDLKDYEKILKQRNTILSEIASGKSVAAGMLDVWNDQLIEKGSALMLYRSRMVQELNISLSKNYQTISHTDDQLVVHYKPDVNFINEADLKETFARSLRSVAWKEKRRGISLAGPHRDEYLFAVGGRELRKYGSRGEHKSTLVSLKASEAAFLRKKTETNPILLLDDLYSELDKERSENVLSLFSDEYQVLITGTSFDFEAARTFENQKAQRVFFVKEGRVSLSE